MCGTVREVGLEKLGEEMALELSLGGKREQRGGRPLKWGHGLNKDQIQVGGGRAQGWEKGAGSCSARSRGKFSKCKCTDAA